jgi:hypothetical protein
MKTFFLLLGILVFAAAAFAQNTFTVTGTPIPSAVLELNYGKMPKGISGYDLSICNTSSAKQAVVSSEIFQVLAQENISLQPIGREIMLAAILRNKNLSKLNILGLSLNAATGVFSVLSSSKYAIPAALGAVAALGALTFQQLTNSLKPVLPADQLEKFDSQVLEPALVLDSGSCLERTVFTLATDPKAKARALSFHVR